MVKKSEFITFKDRDRDAWVKMPRKTKVVEVRTTLSDKYLGVIRWYSGWRQYVFEPDIGTIFNPECMTLIAETTATMTKEHREALQNA